ncbi:hypothetical protein CONCODRAFT_10540 [Conidiobolus coronatus NRRL 28638]|uniref:Uncharacterized protein n=1 Tax=Conidiobolus coronatus (strain ATCC 28846 / CBS 209.66 / NRRL 28638) TaxID=796925 RepID=A0A137NXJ3_CONC2|nr:hypothetical protein CONCODRAFT_10540 [Conidiobolus coronatus NRRL 28638]|eukprot:KXN67391.1 hypothetical protein CONCODRAFT_10540 [Conidiobolus coronatus NRRL 28638]
MKLIALIATSVLSQPIQLTHKDTVTEPSYYSWSDKYGKYIPGYYGFFGDIGKFADTHVAPLYFPSSYSSPDSNKGDKETKPSYYSFLQKFGRFVDNGAIHRY